MRHYSIYKLLTLFLILLMLFKPIHSQTTAGQKKIIIEPNQSHTFMFTNTNGLFYFGETGLPNTSKYQGLSFLTHEFLEDYVLEVGGTLLERSQAKAVLSSDSLTRIYNSFDITEKISISDSLPVMIANIKCKNKYPFAITPMISGSAKARDYVVHWSSIDKILYIARKNHVVRNDNANYPAWIGISTYPAGEFSEISNDFPKRENSFFDEKSFIPGKINIFLEENAYLFFIIGDNKEDVLQLRNKSYKNLNLKIQKKDLQIEGIRKV
ncbi:hypothetical protein B6I21_07930 [candidate division KSB1 bacterium 4572_119]|nr:MAG: hypothetical protein B6I21_07930 [candidate division KSB1 bacterium 4572_119]